MKCLTCKEGSPDLKGSCAASVDDVSYEPMRAAGELVVDEGEEDKGHAGVEDGEGVQRRHSEAYGHE